MAALFLAAMAAQGLSTASTIKTLKLNEKINNNILGFNASLAKRDAELALGAGLKGAERVREDTTSLISRQRASFAASNIVSTSGSPLLAQLKQREEGEKAAQNAILESRVAASGFSAKAALAEYQIKLNKFQGKQSRKNALLTGIAGGVQTGSKFI
jgi:hypothetical protein